MLQTSQWLCATCQNICNERRIFDRTTTENSMFVVRFVMESWNRTKDRKRWLTVEKFCLHCTFSAFFLFLSLSVLRARFRFCVEISHTYIIIVFLSFALFSVHFFSSLSRYRECRHRTKHDEHSTSSFITFEEKCTTPKNRRCIFMRLRQKVKSQKHCRKKIY